VKPRISNTLDTDCRHLIKDSSAWLHWKENISFTKFPFGYWDIIVYPAAAASCNRLRS